MPSSKPSRKPSSKPSRLYLVPAEEPSRVPSSKLSNKPQSPPKNLKEQGFNLHPTIPQAIHVMCLLSSHQPNLAGLLTRQVDLLTPSRLTQYKTLRATHLLMLVASPLDTRRRQGTHRHIRHLALPGIRLIIRVTRLLKIQQDILQANQLNLLSRQVGRHGIHRHTARCSTTFVNGVTTSYDSYYNIMRSL